MYSKFLLFLISLIFSVAAMAEKPLPGLPIWSANNTNSSDALIFVNTSQQNLAHRLYLWDLINLPPFSSSSFVMGKPITGFNATPGVVAPTDSLVTALSKIVGNLNSIEQASVSVGTFDSKTPSANGAVIDDNELFLQSASATMPGLVNTTSQTFKGAKTFSDGVVADVTGTASGNELPLTFSAPFSRVGNTISCTAATSSVAGCLSSTDWNTFNSKQNAISVTDTNSVDLTFAGDDLKADVKISSTGADVDYTAVEIKDETDGLRAQVASGDLSETTSEILTITGGSGAVLGGGVTIAVKKASATQDGYLAAEDFDAFEDAISDNAQDISDHINETTDAHAASAIGVTPTGDVEAEDVQAAIAELDSEKEPNLPSGENGLGLELDNGAKAWKAQAPRNNWLVNESFEYADEDASWSTSGVTFSADTSEKILGKQSIKMPAGGAASIDQSVTPSGAYAGQNIVHSIWVKTPDASVGICAVRAGDNYECKNAVADNLWHQYSFAFKDPGTGTRGITVYRLDSGTGDTFIDAASVGYFEPNFPATINVGGTDLGTVSYSTALSSDALTTSTSYVRATSASTPAPVVDSEGFLAAPSDSTGYGFKLVNPSPDSVYEVTVSAGFYRDGAAGQSYWKLSDGSSLDSNEVGSTSGGTIQFSNSVNTFRIAPTSSASVDLYLYQKSSSSGVGTYVKNDSFPTIFNVKRLRKESQLAGAIITDEPISYLEAIPQTRVTTTPSKLGEYRSLLRTGSGGTYSTDSAPAILPNGKDGFAYYLGRAWSTGDSTNQPSQYQIFVGKNLAFDPIVTVYKDAGKSGVTLPTDVSWNGNLLFDLGLVKQYDSSSGVLTISRPLMAGSSTNHALIDGGNFISTGGTVVYISIALVSNPLAAGMKTAEDTIEFDTYAGYGSTNTKVPYFTNSTVKGDALSISSNNSTSGAIVAANKLGMYCISGNIGGATTTYVPVAIVKNGSASYTTDSLSLSNSVRKSLGMVGQPAAGHGVASTAWCGILDKGDTVNLQTDGSVPAQVARANFTIAKVPSPFEVAGGMPGGGNKTYLARFNSSGTLQGSSGWVTGNATNGSAGVYTVPVASGIFSKPPVCSCNNENLNTRYCNAVPASSGTSLTSITVWTITDQVPTNGDFTLTCGEPN